MSDDDKRQQFIDQYVLQFMAAFAANRYSEACHRGTHYVSTEIVLVEEAESYAEDAWVAFQAYRNPKCHCSFKPGDATDPVCPVHGDDDE